VRASDELAHMPEFDVFISYSKRRHIARARSLFEFLISAGFRVWFDEEILNRKVSWVPVPKDAIIGQLTDAIAQSRCIVLFAMEMEAVHVYPGLDVKKGMASHQLMRSDQGNVIAWNWQIFESRCAREVFPIYGGESWESIAQWVRNQGIVPRPTVTARKSALLRRVARWISRKRRVRALFRIPCAPRFEEKAADGQWHHTNANEVAFRLNRARMSSYENLKRLVLIGEHGSGRTTALHEGLSLLAEQIKERVLLVDLPERDDLEGWLWALSQVADKSVLAVDDFAKQIESFTPTDSRRICNALAAQFRGHSILLTMTEEDAEEYLRPPSYGRKDCYLDGMGEVSIWRPSPWTSYELEAIVKIQIVMLRRERLVDWVTKKWSEWELVRTLENLPFFDPLRPVDYTSLQGQSVANPKRCLLALEAVERVACTSKTGDSSRIVTDESVEMAFAELTGFSRSLFQRNPRDRDGFLEDLSSQGVIEAGLAKTAVADFVANVAGSLILHADRPIIGCIRDRDARHNFALLIARRLLGSNCAAVFLDYDALNEQRLSWGPTEALSWVMRAVARYPFWVIVIDSIGKAYDKDGSGLREMMHTDHRSDPNPFRHCVILLDDVPEFLHSDAADLDSSTRLARLSSWSKRRVG
jgi:hypothetical protein